MAPSTDSNPSASTDSTSKSGIVTSANGQRSIPSSVRADGTKRKEIKIRPGYRPPEDVEVYRNRGAEAFRTRGKGAGVPGADVVKVDDKKEMSAASAKNAKRREARKKAKAEVDAAEGGEGDDCQTMASNEGRETAIDDETTATNAAIMPQENDEEVEKEKKAKKLRKKLREARDLQQKKERGEGLLPEQLQKALRMHELIRELDQLGFGAEEESKES